MLCDYPSLPPPPPHQPQPGRLNTLSPPRQCGTTLPALWPGNVQHNLSSRPAPAPQAMVERRSPPPKPTPPPPHPWENGCHILNLLQIGGSTRPARVRVLDLPFTAVEWLLPSDMLASGGDPLTPAKWMVWDRSPLAKERSLTVSQLQHLNHAVVMHVHTPLFLSSPLTGCTFRIYAIHADHGLCWLHMLSQNPMSLPLLSCLSRMQLLK